MSSAKRRKRPELDRTAPKRTFSGLFGQPSAEGKGKRSTANGGATHPADAVPRGVDLGYQVIEDYIRQGQAFARTAWAPYLPNDRRGVGDAQRLTERMFQYASDLAAVWLEYVQVTAAMPPPQRSAPSASRPAPVGGFDVRSEPVAGPDHDASDAKAPVPERPGSRNAHAESPNVSVELTSTRRVRVSVDLRPGCDASSLSAHDLRAADPVFPRITGVVVESTPSDGDVVVRIAVPADQPAGTYSGVIVDRVTNLPRGTLTVRVFAPES